jgi:hypothetical protein
MHFAPDRIEVQILREALMNNRNISIRTPNDDYLGQSWAPWFERFPDAKSFVLLPLTRQGALLGLLYADHMVSNVQGWTEEEQALVEQIKCVLGSALEQQDADEAAW